jgi:hypothetical protein
MMQVGYVCVCVLDVHMFVYTGSPPLGAAV